MIGKLFVVIAMLVAGVLTGSWLIGTPLISFSDLQGHAGDLMAFMQEHWLKLVGAVGGAVGGISILASKIIGRKNQAINTLSEASTQKDKAIGYLEGQLQREGEIEALTEKYGADAFSKIEGLSTELQVTKTTLNSKIEEIKQLEDDKKLADKTRHNLEEEKRYLNAKIKELEYERDVALGIIKPPVT